MTAFERAAIFADAAVFDSAELIAREKAEGKAKRMLRLPECARGLPGPRTSPERQARWLMTRDGRDVTAQFEKGALVALRLARLFGCEEALLKERSPSCGSGEIYDGSFCGRLVPGYGTAAELMELVNRLHNAGIGAIMDFVPVHFALEFGSSVYINISWDLTGLHLLLLMP